MREHAVVQGTRALPVQNKPDGFACVSYRRAGGRRANGVGRGLDGLHARIGRHGTPAADTLRSEPFIVTGIAKATLAPNPKVPWDAWVGNYALVRDAISDDISRLGLVEGATVVATTAVDDRHLREMKGLGVTPYDIRPGCVADYYPECNPLLPLAPHADKSFVPAAKSTPTRLRAT